MLTLNSQLMNVVVQLFHHWHNLWMQFFKVMDVFVLIFEVSILQYQLIFAHTAHDSVQKLQLTNHKEGQHFKHSISH
jgi:hypothetical protein